MAVRINGFLVGGTGEPMLVGNINQPQAEIDKLRELKATKLHLWIMSIPLPQTPLLILAFTALSKGGPSLSHCGTLCSAGQCCIVSTVQQRGSQNQKLLMPSSKNNAIELQQMEEKLLWLLVLQEI